MREITPSFEAAKIAREPKLPCLARGDLSIQPGMEPMTTGPVSSAYSAVWCCEGPMCFRASSTPSSRARRTSRGDLAGSVSDSRSLARWSNFKGARSVRRARVKARARPSSSNFRADDLPDRLFDIALRGAVWAAKPPPTLIQTRMRSAGHKRLSLPPSPDTFMMRSESFPQRWLVEGTISPHYRRPHFR
jgi:hypothetical protein